MLTLYQSNRMNTLADLFVQNLATGNAGLFEPETVIVQSFGTGRWLKLALADKIGIAANIACILPATFIWRLYQQVLPTQQLSLDSAYTIEPLTWRLMSLLSQLDTREEYLPLQRYLDLGEDDNRELRRYQLSRRIAGLYDQYLVYRPEWILSWDRGLQASLNTPVPADLSWQPLIWRQLTDAVGQSDHRASLHQALLTELSKGHGDLPQRVSVFGLSSLANQQIEVLEGISERVNVDIYFLNPSQHYWGDIVSERNKARLVDQQTHEYLDTGNPLLASLGRQGRDFHDLLLQLPAVVSIDAWDEADPDESTDMLATIQQDILNLTIGGQTKQISDQDDFPSPEKMRIGPEDLSLQVHACHTPLRELEVLLDQLQHLMLQDPNLKPRDIIVMMPDVSVYAPFIEAVFGQRMNYSIADQAAETGSPTISSFLALLALPESRMTAPEIMDLLESPAIHRKFGLHEDDLTQLSEWIDQSGIRWGLDADDRNQTWSLPPDAHNTWEFGLDRLLLGYAMSSSMGLFNGQLPTDINGQDRAELLGTLVEFVDTLKRWRKQLQDSLTLEAWQAKLNELMDELFLADGHEELELDTIRAALDNLVKQKTLGNFNYPVGHRLIRYWLSDAVRLQSDSRGFLSGGMTFCTLVPMRSIPFKVVCLVGMNDGDYPRQTAQSNFDLMTLDGYRKGDRSRRDDDRYLCLEALLSAEQTLYISYLGRGLKDNNDRVPSVVISELISYCDRIFQTREGQSVLSQLVVKHPLQPFDPEYFTPGNPRLVSYQRDWYRANLTELASTFYTEPLEVDPDVPGRPLELDKFISFIVHPVRFFFREALGVNFPSEGGLLSEQESFLHDALEAHNLRDSALRALVEETSRDYWQSLQLASGAVLPNALGYQQLNRYWEDADHVYQRTSHYIETTAQTLAVSLNLTHFTLSGQVAQIYGKHQLFYRTGTGKHRQWLATWLNQLALNAAGHDVESVIIDAKTTHLLTPVDPAKAITLLEDLLGLYHHAWRTPLPLFPESSYDFAREIAGGSTGEKAMNKALSTFNSDRPGSESTDVWYRAAFHDRQVFDDTFAELALRVFTPLIDQLQKV